MRVDTISENNKTKLLLSSTSEKDIIILTEMLNITPQMRKQKMRSVITPTKRMNGSIVGAYVHTDALINTAYLKSIGFEREESYSFSTPNGAVQNGYFFSRGGFVMFRRINSTVFRIYKNAKIDYKDGKAILKQIDKSKKIEIIGKVRYVSELSRFIY